MKKTIFLLALLTFTLGAQAQKCNIKSDSTQSTLRISVKEKFIEIREPGADTRKTLDQAQKALKDAQLAFKAQQDSKELEAAFVKAQKAVFEAGKNIKPASPLIFFDNKEISKLSEINPDNIESISVLKDGASLSKYGDKAKNGVVLVTSKKSQMTPEMIAKARFEHISNAINLTDKQKQTFEKIYNGCDEKIKAHSQGMAPSYQRGKPLTAEQVLSELERSAIMPTCRAQMYKDLKKILKDEQIVLLYNAERRFMSSVLSSHRNINVTVRDADSRQHSAPRPNAPKK